MVAFLGTPVAVLLGAICLAKKYPVESGTGIGGWLVVPGLGVCLMPVLLAWVTVVSLMEADWQEMPAAEIAGDSALVRDSRGVPGRMSRSDGGDVLSTPPAVSVGLDGRPPPRHALRYPHAS
jgi:hypothetical protein